MNSYSVSQREIFGYERRLRLGECGVAKQSAPPTMASGDAGRSEIFYSPRRKRGAALSKPENLFGGTVAQPDRSSVMRGSPDTQSRGEIFGSARRLRLGGTSALDEAPPSPETRHRPLRRARSQSSEVAVETLGGHFDRKDQQVDEQSRHKEIFGGRRELRSVSPPFRSSSCDTGPMPNASDSWQGTKSADFGRVDIFNTTRRKRGNDHTMQNQMSGSITAAARHGQGDGGETVKRGEIFGTPRRVRAGVEEVELDGDQCGSPEPRLGGDAGPALSTPRETPRSGRRLAPVGYSRVYQQKLFGRDWQSSADILSPPAALFGASGTQLPRPRQPRSSSAEPRTQGQFGMLAAGGASRVQTAESEEDSSRARSTQVAALVSPRLTHRRLSPRSRYREHETGGSFGTSEMSAAFKPAVDLSGSTGGTMAGSWCDRDATAIAEMRRHRGEPSWRSAVTALHQQKDLTPQAAAALQSFDQDAVAAERTLEGHFQKELSSRVATLERSDMVKQKFSSKLLELRASERALAKNRDYAQAAVVKRQAEAQERIERAQHASQHEQRKAHLQAVMARKTSAATVKLQKGLYEELWRRALMGQMPVPPKA